MANSTADNLDKNIFWPRISATKKKKNILEFRGVTLVACKLHMEYTYEDRMSEKETDSRIFLPETIGVRSEMPS